MERERMSGWWRPLAALVLLLLAGCAPQPQEPVAEEPPRPVGEQPQEPVAAQALLVSAVIDGDTIDIATPGGVERVRLLGINAPERSECFGQESTATLAALLATGEVVLEEARDDAVELGADARHLALGDALAAQRAHQVVDPACRDTLDVRLLDDRQQRARRGVWVRAGPGNSYPGAASGSAAQCCRRACPSASAGTRCARWCAPGCARRGRRRFARRPRPPSPPRRAPRPPHAGSRGRRGSRSGQSAPDTWNATQASRRAAPRRS